MANLTINILTKYAEAEKGFTKISGTLTKYRNELLKANAEGKKGEELVELWGHYKTALNNVLKYQHLTKDGMAELTAQSKTLARELVELDAGFGSENENVKELNKNFDSVKKDMADLTDETSKMGGKFGDTGLKLLSVAKNILKVQLLMGPITAVVRGFRNTLSDSVKVAAEAEQVFNKLTTVFDGFGDSAKRMASTLASSIGVANSTAASALSTVGDLLQAQGMGTSQSLTTAADWVRQFQDIIAFKDINMTLEEFAQNFMSGAAGNLRNFRTFGSIVKESAVNAQLAAKGLDKLTGSELELAKMTTRAEMALSQQANAMGATRREWDTMLSVNRRYDEATKALKESLGDMMNSVLKPIKSWWTEILEEINKANKAQKEFAEGSKDIQVYDIKNNKKDASKFESVIKDLYKTMTVGDEYSVIDTGDAESDALMKALDVKITIFGATVNDVTKILGDKLTPAMREYLETQEALRRAEVARQREIERQRNVMESVSSAYDSFAESIKAITGVKISTPDWTSQQSKFLGVQGGDTVFSSNIAQSVLNAVSASLASISENSSKLEKIKKTWGDVISGALEELDEGELYQSVAESFRSLFETAWNEFGKDGDFSDEEKARLEEIKKAYQEAKEASEAYQKRLEAEAGIKGHIGNAQDVLWEAATRARFARAGVPSDQMNIWIKYEKQLEDLREKFGKVAEQTKKPLDEVTIEVEGQLYTLKNAEDLVIDARSEEIDAMKKEEEEVTKLSEIIAQGIFGENASAGYAQKFSSAVANSTGGQVVQAGMDGGVVGILVEILTQTETFTETLKSFDPIITTFSEFIKPILPAVQLIFNVINELVFSILKPFFPIIKGIAMVVASLAYPIKIVTNVIKNIYTAVHNILERITHPISGGDRWNYVSLTDGVSDILDTVRRIGEMTFDIRENTDPNNSEILKAYNNMFQKGLITASEYQGLLADINGLNYDRMRTYHGGSWNNGGGVTNVYYGDMKFEINGTNLSADQIAEAVTRKQMEWSKTGQYA